MELINSDDVEDPNKETVYRLLEDVFESSILEADLSEPIEILTKLYASFSGQGFESSFQDILMLTVYESKRSNDVQKLFRFISDFVVSLDNKYKAEHAKKTNKSDNENGVEDDDEPVHPYLINLFATLISWSKASSYVIRFRSCQLLYMILTNVLDAGAGEIDVKTYEKIATLIQSRRKDISANVRAHAVLLAKFFQDPSDHTDPVIAALCWQLQTDPNPRVRQNILDIIAACEETIIPVTRRFLHDLNSLVRNSALLHICHRISPRSYTTQHRILILNQCFYDSSAIVRRNAEQKLVPMWFRAYGDKLCVFIKNLRLGNDCLDKLPFTRPLIRVLFKLVKISQILEEIELDQETALPKALNAEKIFIWRNFYVMASQQEKLKKFIPQHENLIELIIKHFTEPSFNEACAYNELISFTMDVMDILGEEICEKLPPLAIDIMKNPFTPRDIIPYAVTFYCEYASKETKEIHNDLLEAVNDLMKFIDVTAGEEQKKMVIKCLDIFSETLAQDNISANVELMAVKDELVLLYLDSDDNDIKAAAFRALALYCLLDLEEARQFWPLIEKTIYESSDTLKLNLVKGAFDVFKSHGCKLFGEQSDEAIKTFEEALEKLLSHTVDTEIDLKIVLKGMFKLYLSHHTYSPTLLAQLILFVFDPEEGHIIRNNIVNFLELYGESREEAECLTRSFLVIINLLFSSGRSSPYHKINIKTVALQLLEFAKLYEENRNFDVQEKFRDLLILKLTKKFIKWPWRISVMELQDLCDNILPKDVEKLIKLKANVKVIVDSLDSAVFQKKNPFSKKSIKFFQGYMKKIQTALDTLPEEENHCSQRLNSTSDSSFLSKVPIEQVSPVVSEDISF